MQSGPENEAGLAFRLSSTFWTGQMFADLWLASLTFSLPPQDLVLCSTASLGRWAGAPLGCCSGPVSLRLNPGPHVATLGTGAGLLGAALSAGAQKGRGLEAQA